jgi:hypothetical protein
MYNRDLIENQNGSGGIEFITDAVAHVAPNNQKFVKLQVLSAAVIAEILPQPTGNDYTGATLAVGTTINFEFTSIKLTSGSVLVTKGV